MVCFIISKLFFSCLTFANSVIFNDTDAILTYFLTALTNSLNVSSYMRVLNATASSEPSRKHVEAMVEERWKISQTTSRQEVIYFVLVLARHTRRIYTVL